MRVPGFRCAALFITGVLLIGNAFAGKPVNDERAVFVTGSLIPKRIKLKPIGTTTVSPIRIIDRREIDQAGRQTTPGIFVADPSVRVTGR